MRIAVIDRLRADDRLADALGELLGQKIGRTKTTRVRCPNGAAHANGDRHPSAVAQPDNGRLVCSLPSCGLDEGLLDLAVRAGHGSTVAEAAAWMESHWYPATSTNGHATRTTPSSISTGPAASWPYAPETAMSLGWEVVQHGGRTCYRIPVHDEMGDVCRLKFRGPREADGGVYVRSTPTSEGRNDEGLVGEVGRFETAERGTRVLIVEGETDLLRAVNAARFEGLDLIVVSPSNGAGAIGATGGAFRGLRVVVAQDADKPGREGATAIGAKALAGGAAEVLDVNPSTLGAHDVRAYLDAGGTLRELLDAATAGEPHDAPDATGFEAAENDAWDPAVPLFSAGEPAPLDLALALPPEFADAVQRLAVDYGVHESVMLMLLLSFLAAAAGNGWAVQASRTHVEPSCSRFGAAILDPGERKSAVMRPFMRALEAWLDSDMARELRRRRATDIGRRDAAQKAIDKKTHALVSAEDADARVELERQVMQLREEAERAITPDPRFWVDDATSQAATLRLADAGGTIAVISSEARDFVANVLGAYRTDGRTDDVLWLKVHGGDTVHRDRVSREGAHVARPAGAVAVLVQSDAFGDLVKSKSLARGGFSDRVHWLRPPSLVGTRRTDDEDLDFELLGTNEASRPVEGPEALVTATLTGIIAARYRLVMADRAPRYLALEPGVRREARDWASALETRQAPGGDLSDHKGRASKTYGEALRLAGLLHLATHPDPDEAHSVLIPPALWRHAAYVSEWSLHESLRALAGAASGEWATWALALYEYVERNGVGHGPHAAREIARWGIRTVTETKWVEARMTWLVRQGWAREVEPEGRKRAVRWILRPERPKP